MNKFFIALAVLLAVINGCTNNPIPSETETAVSAASTPVINYAVEQFYPHDTSYYTEGLLVHDGRIFESTGSPQDLPATRSMIGIIDLNTGKMDKKIEIDRSKYFGEGIAVLNNKLYQLTYTTQVGFIYDLQTFSKLGEFTYNTKQGWGLTTDGKHLIMDDGTDVLTFLDPAGMKPVRSLAVSENGLPIDKLNELEYIKGYIYANVWQTDFIVKIDPANGKVVARLDLSSLAFEARNKFPRADVLNGIAYDSAADKIYVTGKFWPNIYQLRFAH